MAVVENCQDKLNMKNDTIREFVGKVKIVLVDSPKNVYLRKRWIAAFITLSQMLIGITNMMILFYVLSFKSDLLSNLHVFLCSVGFQLCIPSGILSLNYLNGSTIPMSTRDKKFEHVFLETFGLICCLLGSVSICLETGFITKMNLHAILGIVAGCLVLLSGVSGLCSYGKGIFANYMKYVHVTTGVLGFLTSSLCFISGFYTPNFEKWVPQSSVTFFLGIFCFMYSIVITLASFKNL